jgi:epoxyqueuosine reductase
MKRDDVLTMGRIKELALSCGFADAGVSEVSSVLPEAGRLKRFLQKGFHGEMEWLEARLETRLDPTKLLEGAHSVISVLFPYARELKSPLPEDWGKLSRYVRVRDYHLDVKERLQRLIARIREEAPGTEGYCTVDSTPVLEKAFAVSAGLGWRGKNSLILNREFGSFFFLGEIILNRDVAPDAPYASVPVPDECGDCRLCMEACPTGALVEPYVLDARKCIAYLTIEKEGTLTREEMKMTDGWIYGCDLCQEACPWNQDRVSDFREAAAPRGEALLLQFPFLPNGEFERRFRENPIVHKGRAGFLRNVATAAGNLKHKQAGKLLRALLQDPDPTVATFATSAMGSLLERK